jgi:glutathione synthase/RimK-type ligase-like ATP-grasp enzyme
MILVCGGLADVTTELFCARLEYMGYPYRLLNLGLYPASYRITRTWDGPSSDGMIYGQGWSLDLAAITGAFVRYIELDMYAADLTLLEGFEQAALDECQEGLAALLEDLSCPVANRIVGSLSNHSKPYQALLVRTVGLRTPHTLITSDPAAVQAFYEQYAGNVIFKSLSSIRSIVRRVEERDLKRLHYLRHGVAQFQAYVPGDNVRVHTVGEQIFATRIRSEAVDYRYAGRQGASIEMESTTLPDHVAAACLRLADGLGLLIAGIDLKQTPDDEWYCFEINPVPHFGFYEQHTGQPISAALAKTLR